MRLRAPGPGVMIFAITSAIFLASPVRGLTDSRYSTLVSEALFRHGSFVLDEWFGDRANLPYQVETVGGHVYYWYPLVSPRWAGPGDTIRVGVGAARALGRGTRRKLRLGPRQDRSGRAGGALHGVARGDFPQDGCQFFRLGGAGSWHWRVRWERKSGVPPRACSGATRSWS